uniref:Transposase n=1 Tax=Acrobeloides nanus TaxID=290746 RepID=A0A914CXI8_9BILA
MANIEQMELDSETQDEEEHQSIETDELDESLEDDEFEYVIVEKSQLLQLLQRCHLCGKYPREKSVKKATTSRRSDPPMRHIKWAKRGVNVTAAYYCACRGKKQIRWSSQPVLEGTQTRKGNIDIVAAAIAAPISFTDLDAFCRALKLPIISKRRFNVHMSSYVKPCISDMYHMQKSDIIQNDIELPLKLAIDGQFDSPGFSAEFCNVSALDIETKKVVTFQQVHKSETDGVSSRMELLGVQKIFDELGIDQIEKVCIDKHTQVIAWLKRNNVDYSFDLWHNCRNINKRLRAELKKLDGIEKSHLKQLGRRFISHIYRAIENAAGNSDLAVQHVYSFFLHVLNIHEWNVAKLIDLIDVEGIQKRGKEFNSITFSTVNSCLHNNVDETFTEPLQPDSTAFKVILQMASSTNFVNDVRRLKEGNVTSFVESYNSVRIHYAPKRKFFKGSGLEMRTMLSIIAWNSIQDAELQGRRKELTRYQYFSKAKGDVREKNKKTGGAEFDGWKRELIMRVRAKKIEYGPGDPPVHALDEFEDDDETDQLAHIFDEIVNFDDFYEDNVDDE